MTDFVLGSLSPRGSRRVIYNSDPSNTTRFLSEPAARPEELREVVRNYAREGAIDTLVQEVYGQGWTKFWHTELCTYDQRPQHQRLVPMMDEGVMPIEVYIDECHRQGMTFLAGFRMNDRHGHNADWFTQLSQEKPSWILKGYRPTSPRTADPRSYEVGCALDYSVEGVRDFLFSIMEAVTNRFDLDGVEFNYTRMTACFPRGQAERSHDIMTGFVRKVRAMLNLAEKQKGRRLKLGVRVLQHLDGCKTMGFDIPTWIEDGLIDYIAPGDIGFTDFNAQFEAFVQLARASKCLVYPQIQAKLGYYHRDLVQSPGHCRAAIQNFYGAGADGFSTQNYFEVEKFGTLKELRDPDKVTQGDRHYTFYPIWGPNDGNQVGYQGDFPYHTEEIVLARDKPGTRGEFRFRMCEDLASEAILTFKPGIVAGDEISIEINGRVIPNADIGYDWQEDGSVVSQFGLGSPPAVYGDNYLGITLIKSAQDATDPIVMNEVEVFVSEVGRASDPGPPKIP